MSSKTCIGKDCGQPAVPGGVGCAFHQACYARVGRELKAPKYRNAPAEVEKVAPVVQKRMPTGPLRVARYVHRQGKATGAELAHELSTSITSARRWARLAAQNEWITRQMGPAGGYYPGKVTPPAEHGQAHQAA